jgi:hypothetical protein
MFRRVLVAALLASSTVASAQVRVEGNRRVPTATILAALRHHSAEADRQAVLDLGTFSEVRVELTAAGEAVHVQENPPVKQIVFTGNQLVPGAKLLSLIPTRVGDVYDSRAVQSDIANLNDYYNDDLDLFLDTHVEHSSFIAGVLTFEMREALILKAVRVTGELPFTPTVQAGEPLKRKQVMADVEALGKAYAASDYPIAGVHPSVDLSRSELTYDVRRLVCQEVRVEGNHKTPTSVVLAALATHPGTLLSRSQLQQDVRTVSRLSNFSPVRVGFTGSLAGQVVVTFQVEHELTDAAAERALIELPGAELEFNLAFQVSPNGLIWTANDVVARPKQTRVAPKDWLSWDLRGVKTHSAACFDKAVELAPNEPLTWEYRAVNVSATRLSDLWHAADLSPHDFHLQALAAISQLDNPGVPRALQRLREAGAPARGYLGMLLFRLGKVSESEALLRANLSDPLCFLMLRYCLRTSLRFDADLALCAERAAATHKPADQIALAGAYARAGRWTEAERTLHGPDPASHLARVAVLLHSPDGLQRCAAALASTAALKLSAAQRRTYTLDRAIYLALSGHLNLARAEAARLLHAAPNDARALRLRDLLGLEMTSR